ncbi:hypothetical protein Tco_0676237, partial [Tanacetum coccineum]
RDSGDGAADDGGGGDVAGRGGDGSEGGGEMVVFGCGVAAAGN